MRFAEVWRLRLEETQNVDFYQEMVTDLLFDKDRVCGVKTSLGLEVYAKSVVLTSGTFLNGLIHIGEKQFGGGRAGESASFGITERLIERGFSAGRMKTGTPPRVDGRSLDYSKMIEQPGDDQPSTFSFLPSAKPLKTQRSCHMTYTNPEVHDLLREGFDRSPMFNGRIQSIGPRYCPSVEDKINRFADKDRHQIFVEPEGWNTVEVYVNGFSTSLPEDIQFRALTAVSGFENVKFFRPGYAIEYDYFPPTQLKHSLETKPIAGLFFAGQINGTTGYEEAAAQGLMAGINAHQYHTDQEPFSLRRDQAYIGVLIDDLITKGTEEPYRMFTSRAEYRTLLRQDNADTRLTPLSHKIGLASDARLKEMEKSQHQADSLIRYMKKTSIQPRDINPILHDKETAEIKQSTKLSKILARPQLKMKDLLGLTPLDQYFQTNQTTQTTIEQAEIQIKYAGYIEKEEAQAQKLDRLESIKIPQGFDYLAIQSISTEARQKLTEIQPQTLSQASRISGVSPSDISVLLVHMGR